MDKIIKIMEGDRPNTFIEKNFEELCLKELGMSLSDPKRKNEYLERYTNVYKIEKYNKLKEDNVLEVKSEYEKLFSENEYSYPGETEFKDEIKMQMYYQYLKKYSEVNLFELIKKNEIEDFKRYLPKEVRESLKNSNLSDIKVSNNNLEQIKNTLISLNFDDELIKKYGDNSLLKDILKHNILINNDHITSNNSPEIL